MDNVPFGLYNSLCQFSFFGNIAQEILLQYCECGVFLIGVFFFFFFWRRVGRLSVEVLNFEILKKKTWTTSTRLRIFRKLVCDER